MPCRPETDRARASNSHASGMRAPFERFTRVLERGTSAVARAVDCLSVRVGALGAPRRSSEKNAVQFGRYRTRLGDKAHTTYEHPALTLLCSTERTSTR